jgi:hypothetical protein
MRSLQPSKHGGQLEAERDDDPAASTQSRILAQPASFLEANP